MKIDPDSPYSVSLASAIASLLVVERHHGDDRAEDLLAPDGLVGRRRLDDRRRQPVAVAAGRAALEGDGRRRRCRPAPSRAGARRPSAPSRCRRAAGSTTFIARTAVSRRPTNSSYADRSTRIRERAQQSWPALSKTAYGALAAARLATSASAKTTLALLPPSSSVTRFTWSAQPAMICLPTSVEPVKQTLRTSGWVTNRWPTTEPWPGSTVNTPSGSPASSASSAMPDRRQRRDLGGLEHHGVAGRQRGRETPAGDRHREVPGHDHADHAERFAEGDVDAARRPGSAGRRAARARPSSS